MRKRLYHSVMNTIGSEAPKRGLQAESLRINAFPQDHDIWRIDWFGSIAFPDRYSRQRHPSVLVYLSKVVAPDALDNPSVLLQPDATSSVHHQIKRWVSVCTVMLLRIGDLWQNQTLVARPSYEQETFEDLLIDPSHVTLIKAGVSLEDDRFLLPLPQHPWHLNNTHSYCTCVNLPDDRHLVVPCMEMIRFYFGSSSELLSRLFTPPLTKDQLFKYVKRSNPKQLVVALADRMPRSSAEDIARIAASQKAW